MFSYKLGLLYKPVENGSVYVSHAISQQPPGGTNFILSSAANNANRPNLDPQKGTNYEVGAKWEFLEGAFAVTGAIFRSTNENELWQDLSDPTVILQIGERKAAHVITWERIASAV